MAAPAIPATSKCRVVVVDDEVAIASTLKAILNHSGFDAHAMFSGQELVDSLETLRPDVLIMDVEMPGMTGTKLQSSLAGSFQTARYFSGQAEPPPPVCC
jgi:FixJ family two-component response regulator